MASSAVPMVVAANMKAAKGGDTQPVVKVCEGWFQKKGGKEGKARARKRWFVLFSDGLIRYYAAVSPDGKPTGEKGNFHVFKDTKVTKTDADGKKGAGRLLLIDALHTDGLEDRQWRLTAETPEQATKWQEELLALTKTLDMASSDHRSLIERRKAMEGSLMKRLGTRVATTLVGARAIMRTFGFTGSVKVSGMLMGLSVSMGIEIEFEEGEGEMEVASPAAANDGETAGEKKSPTVTSDGDVGEDDDDDEEEEEYEEVEKEVDPAYNEPYDLGQEETPEKESAFKRTVRKGMVKAMGKVKVLAYEMKKYKLSGSVGVGVDLSVFGTGISIEFEISLASSITETEFQEMYQREMEVKEGKKSEKRGSKQLKELKDPRALSVSRRSAANVGDN